MALWLFNDPFEYYSRPSRLIDQHFGMGLDPEDFVSPLIPRETRNMMHLPNGYLRPWKTRASQKDVGSTVHFDKDKFQANLDVQQFKPEEISVKVTGDNTVTIEGKHEEKQDEHGFISRHFTRRYVIPKTYNIDKLESKLSSDGVLTVAAPKLSSTVGEEKSIPIQQTGQPSKVIEEKKEVEKKKEPKK